MKYPIAPNGIYATIQGEGALLGTPMVFVRLAGCSVGCPQCDTDYSVAEKLTMMEIRERVKKVRTTEKWVYITGGEPADHHLFPLLDDLRIGFRIALATSGMKDLGAGRHVDFLSVSPHVQPHHLKIIRGQQLNLVPGLNGLKLEDWRVHYFDYMQFDHRWVTPLHSELGNKDYMDECLKFIKEQNVNSREPWRLGVQAHKLWGMP